MNTIRMFAFIMAVLITAVLFRVIADGLTDEQTFPVATEVATDRPQPVTKASMTHTIMGNAPASK
jgi:hypothetical protein